MSRKSRGISAERELIHNFWKNGWAAMRSAGSGNMQFPSPDILAGNNLRKIALEVKISSQKTKYFLKEEILQLRAFSERFGAEPWIAMKFLRRGWRFISLEDLKETPKGFSISIETSERKGLLMKELID